MSTLALVPKPDPPSLVQLVDYALAPLVSECSRASYRGYLRRFLRWVDSEGIRELSRDSVGAYVAACRTQGQSASVLRQNVKAIRLLASEAYARGSLSRRQLEGIVALKMPTSRGVRAGNWLQIEDIVQLMKLPDRTKDKGVRDAAVLGLMVGCGLRRAEIARLEWRHYQIRERRAVLVDLLGKGLKIRTVPVPDWVEKDLNRWKKLSSFENQFVFPHCSTVNLWHRVKKYGALLGTLPGHEHCATLAPHDLRRTFAKLSRKGGAPLEQVSLNLGHSSLTTTILYLGSTLELEQGKAGADFIDAGKTLINRED